MQLLDDALFDLWHNGLSEEDEVLLKSISPGELKSRIDRAKRGEIDDFEDDGDEFDDE